MIAPVVLLAIALLVLSWGVGAYNRLVLLRKQFKNAQTRIDFEWKQRHDLIFGMTEAARPFMMQEHELLEALIAAHGEAVGATAAVAEERLEAALGMVLARLASHPEPQADQNLTRLAEELRNTETRIAFARQACTEGAMLYNAAIAQFPGSIIARIFAFRRVESPQATAELKAAKPAF